MVDFPPTYHLRSWTLPSCLPRGESTRWSVWWTMKVGGLAGRAERTQSSSWVVKRASERGVSDYRPDVMLREDVGCTCVNDVSRAFLWRLACLQCRPQEEGTKCVASHILWFRRPEHLKTLKTNCHTESRISPQAREIYAERWEFPLSLLTLFVYVINRSFGFRVMRHAMREAPLLIIPSGSVVHMEGVV